MRSKWTSTLIAGALASGSMLGPAITSAWAQAPGGWPGAAATPAYAAGASSPMAPGPMYPNANPTASRGFRRDRALMPASAFAPSPRPSPSSPPAWASASAAAPQKKPSAMKRFFSFLWHGGSSASDEAAARPIYRDLATGRTDLPGARPWTASATR
jgi:hypothetical protein